MPRTVFTLLCLLPLLTHAAPSPQSFEGRVVAVADGDTLTVLDSNNLQHKIRVAGIDAPEKGQPFGDRSKQSLSRAVMGKGEHKVPPGRLSVGRLARAPAQ